MNNLDLEFYFVQKKVEILEKLRKTNEKWQKVWQEALGYPAAEAALIHLKLEIQIMEAQALDELRKLEKKIEENGKTIKE